MDDIEDLLLSLENDFYSDHDETLYELQDRSEWRLGTVLHRDQGPALVTCDGKEEWYLFGRLGRRDQGPSRILGCGTIEYFEGGLLHREGGPARILPDGSVEFWRHGQIVCKKYYI